jgi:hypothetical protein
MDLARAQVVPTVVMAAEAAVQVELLEHQAVVVPVVILEAVVTVVMRPRAQVQPEQVVQPVAVLVVAVICLRLAAVAAA